MPDLLLGTFVAALLLTTVVMLDVMTHHSVVYILRVRDAGCLAYQEWEA